MKPVPLVHRFSSKIIAGLIAMLIMVGIPFFFVFLRFYRNQLLETMETSTTSMSRIMTHQLEVSVLEGRHHDLERVVERLSASGDARKIMVIDSDERVMFSSDKSQLNRRLMRHTEPGCRECHTSVLLKDTILLYDSQNRPYYRNVNPIQNRPSCYPCHNPQQSVNGILVMDFSQDALQTQYRASLVRLLGLGGTMLVLTIVVLYILLNQLVLRRLKRFAEAAEQIGQARFGQVSMPGKDEFSQLATSFNLMSHQLESAMKEIQGTKEYLENIINNTDDEIIVLNRHFDVVIANAAHHRNKPALEGEQQGSNGQPGSHASETCACASTFRDGRVHKVVQNVVDCDGKEKHIEVFCSPLRNEAGEVYQVIEVRRDITERKLLEANLAHSERLISMGLLASGLSHELNNPLASISTFVEGLKRRLDDSKASPQNALQGLDDSLGLIQREIDRARDITRRLLVLAQKDESSRSLVEINESLQETILLVRYEASKREIQIAIEPGPDMPILKISESQVRQVFLNLLLNSLQAGHRGGHIWCRTWHRNGLAFVSVEDDGCGIAAKDLLKIFEPFFSKQAGGQGTGLGLFICRSIVSSWGGEIAVESRVNQGTKFTLSFPTQA
jgi:PAS domain S-box-containing protein